MTDERARVAAILDRRTPRALRRALVVLWVVGVAAVVVAVVNAVTGAAVAVWAPGLGEGAAMIAVGIAGTGIYQRGWTTGVFQAVAVMRGDRPT